MNLITVISYFIIFLMGIIAGNFVNVCICNFLEKRKLFSQACYSKKCGHWFSLFEPVLLDYIFWKRKCKKYKCRIHLGYVISEIVNAVSYLTIFALNGFSIRTIICCLFTSALLALSVIDWAIYEIPFEINLFILVIGIFNVAMDYRNITDYVIGFFSVSIVLAAVYMLTKGRTIGGGDIKLMAVSGLILGFERTLLAFLVGCVLGAIIHSIRMKVMGKGSVLAMGPYLSIGIFVSLLWGKEITEWYFALTL